MGTRAADGTSVWFRNIARGKRSIALDLKNKSDLDTFLRLADDADVIVEAFRPGVAARLGIGYDAIAARNPRIVYCSISAFGQNGPLRDKPSHDLGVQALAGTLDLSRSFSDDKPNMPNLVAADMASSLTALSAILMALLARERTDKGEYIDIAMYDSLLAWTPNVVGSVFGEDRAPVPHEMRNYGGQAMNRIYETSDGGFIVLGRQRSEVLRESPARARAARFSGCRQGRARCGAAAADRILCSQTFKAKTLAEWETFLAPIDLCWAPVRSLKEGFGDANALARAMLIRDESGNPHIGPAIKFRHQPAEPDLELPGYAPGTTVAWR